MDKADPRSPFAFLSGKKKSKNASGGASARVQQEEGEDKADADAVAADASTEVDHSLLWRMWRVTKPLVISQGLWQLIATLTEFVPSVAMQQIIDFVSAYEKGDGKVTGRITLFVVLLFVGPVIQGLADGRNFHLGRRIGCRVSVSLWVCSQRECGMFRRDSGASEYSAPHPASSSSALLSMSYLPHCVQW